VRAGTYVLSAHLYDTRHRGMALLTTSAKLGPSAHGLVRFRAFGKLLRDLGVPGPWELRDIEGWLDDRGHVPDRAFLPRWSGPHRTRTFPLDALSNEDWGDLLAGTSDPASLDRLTHLP
ncbi:MAG TPA: hypothetical protein VF395_11890, partial [Polyangiaceae bacterium]